jgi:DNA-binding transcriptional regulator YhcF (GntR family)
MYNLVKLSKKYGEYVDIDSYEKILLKEAKKQNIIINSDQLEEFLEELAHAGLTGEEYRNITSKEILEDFSLYINS